MAKVSYKPITYYTVIYNAINVNIKMLNDTIHRLIIVIPGYYKYEQISLIYSFHNFR